MKDKNVTFYVPRGKTTLDKVWKSTDVALMTIMKIGKAATKVTYYHWETWGEVLAPSYSQFFDHGVTIEDKDWERIPEAEALPYLL